MASRVLKQKYTPAKVGVQAPKSGKAGDKKGKDKDCGPMTKSVKKRGY